MHKIALLDIIEAAKSQQQDTSKPATLTWVIGGKPYRVDDPEVIIHTAKLVNDLNAVLLSQLENTLRHSNLEHAVCAHEGE